MEIYPFLCKIPFLKCWIQLSGRQKNYMPEICQNDQKVDYQGADDKGWTLVLINVNVGF